MIDRLCGVGLLILQEFQLVWVCEKPESFIHLNLPHTQRERASFQEALCQGFSV